MGEEEANPNSFYIASDLLTDIFMRLPLNSLVKFKTVSKEWRSILNSKRFVDMHLNFQKSEKSRRKILAACHCDCEPPPTPFPGDEEIVYLHCESTRPSMSCDGLVCIPEPGWVNVLNPSTGQFRRFPSGPDPVPTPLNFRRICFSSTGAWSSFFPGHWAMGFGRDKVTGSYKVVRMFFDPNNYEILDVNTGEWRKLSPPPYEVDTGRRSACVNGSIYWLDIWRGCCKLLVLDLHTEEFHDAPLGASMVFKMDTQIVNLEDRLATATGRLNSHHEWGLEIWTMDAKETWSKTYSISLASLCIKPLEARWYRPVIASKQGDVVICDNKKRLFRYYQRTDTICQISPRTCVISPYLENMVQLHNEQADLRTEIACIRGNTCIFKDGIAFQSRVDKFLSKGKYLGILLRRSKVKKLASYLSLHLLCYQFCTGSSLIFFNWLVWGNVVKVLVMIFLLKLVM